MDWVMWWEWKGKIMYHLMEMEKIDKQRLEFKDTSKTKEKNDAEG